MNVLLFIESAIKHVTHLEHAKTNADKKQPAFLSLVFFGFTQRSSVNCFWIAGTPVFKQKTRQKRWNLSTIAGLPIL